MSHHENQVITVRGNGKATAVSDLVIASLQCTASSPTVSEAIATTDQAVLKVRESLAGFGISGADASSAGFSVHANERWDENTGPKLISYRVDHNLRVLIRDRNAVGEVLGSAIKAGGDAVRVQDLSPTLVDDSDVRVRARDAAWADALASAGQLAGLAGRSLGKVLGISEGESYSPSPRGPQGRMFAMAADSAVALDVEVSGVEVSTSVSVTWELL